MFDSAKIRALNEELDATTKTLQTMASEKDRLRLENQDLLQQIKDSVDKSVQATQQHQSEVAELQDKITELNDEIVKLKDEALTEKATHQTEIETLKRQFCVAGIDRRGLEMLCNGYFDSNCVVEDVGQALTVDGIFGKTDKDFKLVLSKALTCDHLSQLVDLLEPKSYRELAEAIGLITVNPQFVFGQWATKKNALGEEAFFRLTSVNQRTTRALVVIDKTTAEGKLSEEELMSYSWSDSDTQSIIIKSESHYVFPINIADVIKRVQQSGFIDGLGFSPVGQVDWRKTRLFEDCQRRWKQYYPYVTFHGET